MKKNLLKKLLSVLLITSFTASMAGCQNPDTDDQSIITLSPSAESVEVYKISHDTKESIRFSSADFAINLLKETSNVSSDNVLISPISIQATLAMSANGANGDTLSAMTNVLCGDNTIDELNAYMASYLPNNDMITSVNGIWVSDVINPDSVNQDFIAVNSGIYNAEFRIAKFDDTVVNDINNFVNTNTNGMIPDIVEDLDPLACVVLVNAITFEGKWADEYKDYDVIEGKEFNNIDGSISKITGLISIEDEYCSNENCTGFIKYYENRSYAFMALLPNEDISLEDFINTLDGEAFLALYDDAESASVSTMIPEFSLEYNVRLNSALADMGMGIAFSKSADFSNMISGESDIMIGKVYHKTYITVDRTGTAAAAATEEELDYKSADSSGDPYFVFLDRPFVYAIIDTNTGLPVFLGTVTNL